MQTVTLSQIGLINPSVKKGSRDYEFSKNQLRYHVWSTAPHPADGRKKLIDYGSIPAKHKARLGLPFNYTDFQKVVKDLQKEKDTAYLHEGYAHRNLHLVSCLRKEVERGFAKYISGYAAEHENNIAISEKYSREHALRVALVQKAGEGVSKKDLHEAHVQLSVVGTQNNYTKFTVCLNHVWNNADGVRLTHAGKGKERPDLQKLSEGHKAIIEELYKHPNQYSHNLITELLNNHSEKNGLAKVVRRTVSGYIQQKEIYNRLLIFRNKEAFGKKIKPLTRRTGALYAGDLYYMDGSPTQIGCWNREGTRIIRPTLFVVLDSYSRKIPGFYIAETEDRHTWFGAMKMAFSMESSLPYEIVYDNASATGTPEFKQLNEKLLLNGCSLRAAKPGAPTAKAQVERWFGTFQSMYQRLIDGFIGEGIRSKRETGRIDAEYLKKVKKENGVFTFDSLVEIISYLIAAYNQKGSPKHPNPSKLYAESSKPNIIALQPEQLALLFWNSRPITIRNCEVKMTVRHNDYFYAINNYALNGQTVNVFYDEADLSTVHLFDTNNQYICEATHKVLYHEARANQTEADRLQIMGQSSHKKSFERKLIQDGNNRTQAAKAEFGDDLLKILNPLEMLKENYNNAETDAVLNYVREHNNVDTRNVTAYKPVSHEPSIEKRHSKKHNVVNPELVVVGKR